MSQAKQSGGAITAASEAATSSSSSSRTRSSNTLGLLKYVNVLAFLLNVVVTYGIGTAGWFDLPTNSELSAKYQTLVTPIGYSFAIWGIIFILQAIWCFQQLLDYWNVLSIITIESINNIHYGYVFIVLSQIAWTICFSQEFILGSLVAMVCIWWNLLQTVRSLPTVSTSMVVNTIFQIWPFTIHFGWITAATIVNMNIVLVNYGLSTNIQYWSAIGGVVVLVLVGGIIMALRYGYIIPPLVLCWALWGVYAELTNKPQESITDAFTESQLSTLQGGVVGAIASIGLCLLWSLVVQRWFCRRRRNNNSNEHSSTDSSAAGTPYRRVQDGAGRL